MKETQKTIAFSASALVLALLAFVMSSGDITPDAFLDQGQQFYPDFTDPNEATTLEVIEFDQQTGEPLPFKVTFAGGRWSIPSHYDYPVDGKDRLAKTAAGVIGISRDDFRSDNVSDHALCGVIDPLDETNPSLSGRGSRVTLKSSGGAELASFIIGARVPGRAGFRFVRLPDQKRVYSARMDLDLSTNFVDWIEPDLLQTDKEEISKVVILDYSINERTGRINQRDNIILSREREGWSIDKAAQSKMVDTLKLQKLLTTLDSLTIVGVRPKPAGLSSNLRAPEGAKSLTNADLVSLQGKGYFVTSDGSLRSNEGEINVFTSAGLTYTLRFGEIVYGSGAAVSAGAEGNEDPDSGPGENRYLFVSATATADAFPEPKKPGALNWQNKADSLFTDEDKSNRDLHERHTAWLSKVAQANELSQKMNARFADWYYVISAESFARLDLQRSDLLTDVVDED